mmetsp:Transcript_3581/g.10446  ORF Transcript_3581/g.10446 Transcript_3581/m.10446 type:complete len:246 (-) Transcript_3581:504-1241(-)
MLSWEDELLLVDVRRSIVFGLDDWVDVAAALFSGVSTPDAAAPPVPLLAPVRSFCRRRCCCDPDPIFAALLLASIGVPRFIGENNSSSCSRDTRSSCISNSLVVRRPRSLEDPAPEGTSRSLPPPRLPLLPVLLLWLPERDRRGGGATRPVLSPRPDRLSLPVRSSREKVFFSSCAAALRPPPPPPSWACSTRSRIGGDEADRGDVAEDLRLSPGGAETPTPQGWLRELLAATGLGICTSFCMDG